MKIFEYCMVDRGGLEPPTIALRGRCSTNWAIDPYDELAQCIELLWKIKFFSIKSTPSVYGRREKHEEGRGEWEGRGWEDSDSQSFSDLRTGSVHWASDRGSRRCSRIYEYHSHGRMSPPSSSQSSRAYPDRYQLGVFLLSHRRNILFFLRIIYTREVCPMILLSQ